MNLFFAKKAGLTLDDVLIYEPKQLKRATIMAARLFHVMYVFKKRELHKLHHLRLYSSYCNNAHDIVGAAAAR